MLHHGVIADRQPASVVTMALFSGQAAVSRISPPNLRLLKDLDRARVEVFGGQYFGEGWNGFVRLNFAASCDVLYEMLRRVASVCAV